MSVPSTSVVWSLDPTQRATDNFRMLRAGEIALPREEHTTGCSVPNGPPCEHHTMNVLEREEYGCMGGLGARKGNG